MTAQQEPQNLSKSRHAALMADYIKNGEKRAKALGNRGPIKYDKAGKLHPDILEAYRKYGFYIFEDAITSEELAELRSDIERVLERAPVNPDSDLDRAGNRALGAEFIRPSYRFAKPLSDPLGGTTKNKGRHPVKMLDPTPSEDAPDWTIELLIGNLQLMESCLRLYGHPGLLAAAEAMNGSDFVPYNEVVFIKEPGLGPSVAWHQDGTTHWDAPDWDQNAHGFNFMTQLYPSTAANCVWVLPGSHKLGKVDIVELVQKSGSERIDGAVPMICNAGDVMMVNRQLVHGSFANSSPDRRVTVNAGFFPRKRVLNVTTSQLNGTEEMYDANRIHERSRMIAIAIDARRQRYPDEFSYQYQPLSAELDKNRFNAENQQNYIRNYNLKDIYI
jgi:phytanoyl-CoA dioxygenase PhyH